MSFIIYKNKEKNNKYLITDNLCRLQAFDIRTLSIEEGTLAWLTGQHVMYGISNSIHSLVDIIGGSQLGNVCVQTLSHSWKFKKTQRQLNNKEQAWDRNQPLEINYVNTIVKYFPNDLRNNRFFDYL